MSWDRIVMVDWSGGAPGPKRPRRLPKDKIYIAEAVDGIPGEPRYIPDRVAAERELSAIMTRSLEAGERLLMGFDFPFGYPAGFVRAVTGFDDPFVLWSLLARRLPTSTHALERTTLAAEFNVVFDGDGPFWFDPFRKGTVPMRKPKTFPIAEWREAERRTKGAFSLWQLGGAGAVGSQALTGIATLERLRQTFAGRVSVWPFEPLTAPIAFVEVWPSLLRAEVAAAQRLDEPKDATQVRVLAEAIGRLAPSELEQMLDVHAPEEGWIFGLGHEATLAAAARQGRLRNDCFALPPGVHWTAVDEALDLLKDRLEPVVGREEVSLPDAADRIAAMELRARSAHPPAANSAVDGYGLSAGLEPGLQHIPLATGRAAAGVPFAGSLPEGHAIRILTGAALPEGVNTVVLEEDCRVSDDRISVEGPLKTGANCRKAGEDVSAGDTVVEKGRRITPSDLALLAATGHGTVPVFGRLRVGVLSTGDELREAGSDLAYGQIGDANRPMLLSAIQAMGHEAVDLGICTDDRDALRAAFDGAGTDVLLTSGGASAGEEDHVSALLTETGTMSLWRVAMKPGRPLALGLWRGMPVFGLPGNPVAALVCTMVFARPALSLLAGGGWIEPMRLTVPAAFSKSKKAGRREYLRARLRDGAAEVFKSEGSGRISGLSWAEGLVELPDGALEITPGMPVTYLPFASLLR
ncbi:MAG: gephyrin-like molybdotransferase Glp [Pseudomonadota bacterium]